jgi:hypothetical protein
MTVFIMKDLLAQPASFFWVSDGYVKYVSTITKSLPSLLAQELPDY